MRSISAGPTPGWTGSSKRPGMTSSATGQRPRIFRSRSAFCLYSGMGYDGRRDEAFDAVEAFRERAGVRPPLLHPSLELRELHEADRGRDIGHAVVEADEHVLVLRRLAVVPEETRLFRDSIVVGQDHAAFPGRHVLRRVEREAGGVAEVARLLAVVLGAGGLGRVLDDRDPAFPCRGEDRVHLGGLAIQVDGHDGRGLARDRRRKLRGVHVVRRTIDVDEDGLRAALDDGRGRREERQGRDYHLLARTDAVGEQRDMESGGADRYGDRVLSAQVLRKGFLERLDFRALGEHPGCDDLAHRRELFLAEDRAGDRDHRSAEPAPDYEGSPLTTAGGNEFGSLSGSAQDRTYRLVSSAYSDRAGGRIRTPSR